MPEIKSHSIEYDGFTAIQFENGHIWVHKDGANAAHFNVDRHCTDDELIKYVEFYKQLVGYSCTVNNNDEEDE